MIQRRAFLLGLGAAFAAPAIVRASSLMRVKVIEELVRPPMGAYPQLLLHQPESIFPGMITYVSSSGKKGFWPLFEADPAWLRLGVAA